MSNPRTIPRDLNIASNQLEVFLGSDNIVRVNVDGVCALRVRLDKDGEIVLRCASGGTLTIPMRTDE